MQKDENVTKTGHNNMYYTFMTKTNKSSFN